MLALVLAEPAPTWEGDEGGLMEVLVIDMILSSKDIVSTKFPD